MQFFPLFFRIAGRKVLVVGGGRVAERKVRQLLEYGAVITLVSPEAVSYIANLAKDKIIAWNRRRYIPGEAGDYALIIATTDSEEVNRRIYEDAVGLNIPLNVVDQPDLCTVIFPAVVRRGEVTIAVGTDGRAPFLTKSLKEEIDRTIPEELGRKAELAGIFRVWVMEKCISSEVKQMMFSKFIDNIDVFLNIWSAENPPYELWEKWSEECRG